MACRYLFPYAEPADLIAFFHDQSADMDSKDAILCELITRYQSDDRFRDIIPLLIVLFTPALANIHAYNRRRRPDIDGEDLIQDICLHFIQIIKEIELVPHKVAGRIVGELRNRVRSLLNVTPHEEFIALRGDGIDEFESGQANVASDSVEDKSGLVITETATLLDGLVRAGKITKKERRIIMDTLIGGKSLKDALPPSDYDRIKRRRLRIIGLIKKYFDK